MEKLNIIQQKKIQDIESQIAELNARKKEVNQSMCSKSLSPKLKFKRPSMDFKISESSKILSLEFERSFYGALGFDRLKYSGNAKEYQVFEFVDTNESMTKGFKIVEKCNITEFSSFEEMYITGLYLAKERSQHQGLLKDYYRVILGFFKNKNKEIHLASLLTASNNYRDINAYRLSSLDLSARILGKIAVLV